MNFLCDKCKQKYHVADEKLAGRAVTRFRCKKCDNVIELHAPAPTVPPPAASPATTSTAPVPRATTHAMPMARGNPLGASKQRASATSSPAFGAPGTGARSATLAAGAPRPSSATNSVASADHGWYAGIRDVPVGPLARKELAARIASGDVTPETLVWREGLDDWRPLQAVTELADIMRPSAPEQARTPLRAPITPARGGRPSISDDDEEATRVSGLDPSLAGLVARSIRPGTKPADSKPAPERAPERVRTGASALSPLARSPSSPRATPAPPPRPSDRSNPFSDASARNTPDTASSRTAPRPGGDEAKPSAGNSFAANDPSDATIIPTGDATSGPVEKAPGDRLSPAAPAVVRAPLTFDDLRDDLADELFSKPPAGTRPSTPATRPDPGIAPLDKSDALPVFAAPAAPPVPVASMSPSAATAPLPAPVREAPKSGLPASAWLLMVGVLLAGLAGGIIIGRMNNPPQVQPEPPRPLRRPPPPVTPPLVREDPVPALQPMPDAAADVAEDTAIESPVTTALDASVAHPALRPGAPEHSAHAPAVTPDPTVSAADRERLAAAAHHAAEPVVTGPVGDPGPSNDAEVAVPVQVPVQAPPVPVQRPTQSPPQRAEAIVHGFQSSNVVATCWQATLRQNPALRTATVTIDVGVDVRGHYTTVSVSDSADPRFEACLRSRLPGLAPISPGEAIDARTSVTLNVGN